MTGGFKTILGNGPQLPDKEPQKQACLVIIAGNDIGKTFHINNYETVIGRSEQADFILDDPLISRSHSVILKEKDIVNIRDLNSTNGTYVNFNKIHEKTLSNGDYINVGTTIIKFLFNDSPEAQFHDEIYKLASLDGLTQIYNKKHFKELFEKELSRTARHESPLSLCILDIDLFKNINDTYGHQAGDLILVNTSNKIKEILRKEDIFARYGGEEFCILLPATESQNALIKAEEIRKLIENADFEYNNQKIKVTISIGIHTVPPRIDISVDNFIEEADKKLYASKQNGRNRVTN